MVRKAISGSSYKARTVRRCEVREPVVLDIVVNCQLGRACRFLETSTHYQLEDGDKRMGGRQSDSFVVA